MKQFTVKDMIGFAEWLGEKAAPISLDKWIIRGQEQRFTTIELLEIYLNKDNK